MAISANAIRQYEYSRLGDINAERNCLNVIAVVVDIVRQQRQSRGAHRDALMLVALADETRDRVLATVFASTPDRLPSLTIGSVVIGHRLKSEFFNGELRWAVFPRIGGTLYVLSECSDPPNVDVDSFVDDALVARSILADRRQLPQAAGITDLDLARVRELRRWFRNFRQAPPGQQPSRRSAPSAASAASAASAGASTYSSCRRIALSDLSELGLQSNSAGNRRKFVDLVGQLVAVGRLDDTCIVARVWDGTEVSAVIFRPDSEATNLELDEWSELPSALVADRRYTVDVFVYDEHREPLLPGGSVKLGDLVEFGNLSVRLFKASESVGGGSSREQLLLTLNGGGQNYNRRLIKLDPERCNVASRISQQLSFVRKYRMAASGSLTSPEPAREAAINAATTTVATTTALVTKADARLDGVERVGLAELIKSASESEAGHRIIRGSLLRLLPTSADRLVWLLCPKCPAAAFGPEEFLLQNQDQDQDHEDLESESVDLDADRRRVCRRCRRAGVSSRLRASVCIGLHLTDPDAELLAFAWDAEALRLLAGCYDNNLDDDRVIDEERLAGDVELRRRLFARLRDRLPTGARLELSVLHYRAASNGHSVFSIVDTRLVPEAELAADVSVADASKRSSNDDSDDDNNRDDYSVD